MSFDLSKISADTIANGGTTLIGALLGAFAGGLATFLLQKYFAEKHERQEAILAAHRLMFCLFQQTNTLLLIQRDHIYQHIDSPARFLSIRPTLPQSETRFCFEVDHVNALFDTPDAREHVYGLFMAQESFLVAIGAWNHRSKYYSEQLLPRLAASGIKNGFIGSLADIEAALGPQVFGTIINATENVQSSFQHAYEKLMQHLNLFSVLLKKRFPKEKFKFRCDAAVPNRGTDGSN